MSDRTFLVTGGSSGLGLGIADVLAREGARVAICGRDEDRLASAVDGLRAHGGDVLGVRANVTDPAELDALVETVATRWDRLDGLVNNAGVHTSGGFAEITDEVWQADAELKLFAAARLVRTALPLLRRAPDGASVLTVLSIFARFQPVGSMPSSVYRAAGLALTKGLANELAADRVRANAVLVGFVHSDQWVRAAEAAGKPVEQYEAERATAMGVPLGRAGTTAELADVAAFLLSPRAGYLTGTALNVDGGLSPVI